MVQDFLIIISVGIPLSLRSLGMTQDYVVVKVSHCVFSQILRCAQKDNSILVITLIISSLVIWRNAGILPPDYV